MTRHRHRHRQRVGAAVLLPLALLTAACGTRRSHEEVVLGARGNLDVAGSGFVEATPGSPSARGGTATTAVGGGPVTGGTAGSGAPGGDPAAGGSEGGPAAEGGGAPAAGSPVVIGNVGTYSGPAGPSLSSISVGVRVWGRAVNERGGLSGHPVEVVIADDGGDAARHQALVQELVEQRGAIAFAGNGEALTGPGSVDYLTQRGIPVVGSEGAAQYFYESPVYFPQHSHGDALLQAGALANATAARQRGQTRIGVIGCIEVQVCQDSVDKAEALYAKYGLQVVYKSSASFFEASYTAQCLNAQRAGVEFLSLAMDPGSVSRIAADCAVQGFRPTIAFGNTIIVADHAEDPNLDGAALFSPMAPWFSDATPGQAEFLDAMSRFAPDVEPNPGHFQGWVAGKVLELAAGALGEPATSQQLLDGLSGINGDPLADITSPLLFNRGAPATPTVCAWTATIADGEFATTGGGRQCTEFDPNL